MSSSLSEHFIFALTFNKQVSFLTEDDNFSKQLQI